jgi:hypothetical protein
MTDVPASRIVAFTDIRTQTYMTDTMALKENTSDTDVTLSQIHGGRFSNLVNQLIILQDHTISREPAEEWVARLRFLAIDDMDEDDGRARKRRRLSGGSETPHHPVRTIPLAERHEDDGTKPYIAVSWRWNYQKPLKENMGAYEYLIQRPGKFPHSSKVPNVCLDRAIRFAQTHKIRLIWIDKECIHQEDEKDQNLGIQAMDMVYGQSKWSLGLLMATVETQWQLDCLSKLLSKAVFVEPKGPSFKRTIDDSVFRGILDVLRIILSDERWQRSWIFQEDHCASTRMELLVRCSRSLHKNFGFEFGNIPGELQIPLQRLRQTSTMFYLAYEESIDECDKSLFARAWQYNIRNKIDRSGSEGTFGNNNFSPFWIDGNESIWFQSSSLSILSDIEVRENQKVADRLAIYANCCKFSSRLDTASVTGAGYGLSTCIVALCLLNGEIFRNDEKERSSQESLYPSDMLDCTVQEFLRRFLFEFNPPGRAYHMSRIKHFRFVDVNLTQHGVETVGWLWEMGEVVNFTGSDYEEIEEKIEEYEDMSLEEIFPEQRSLNPVQICVLWIIVHKLNSKHYFEFADYLVGHMRKDKKGDPAPAKPFIDKMVEAVTEGVIEHKSLRVGWVDGEPSGIFVSPSDGIGDSDPSTMAFTSWSKGGRTSFEKFVSLEVRHDSTSVGGARRLYTRAWMNGIWDATGRRKKRFVFPWPSG